MGHILHVILGVTTLSGRCVSRLLAPDNKRNCETSSQQCNSKKFLHLCLTVDKKWIHWYRPETYEKTKSVLSTGKVMTRYLGLTRCDLPRLPEEGQNDHRDLGRIIELIKRQIAEEIVPFHIERSTPMTTQWFRLRIVNSCYFIDL